MNFAHGNGLKLDRFRTEVNQKHLFLNKKPQLGTGYVKTSFNRKEGKKKKKEKSLLKSCKSNTGVEE